MDGPEVVLLGGVELEGGLPGTALLRRREEK
jgi:hypothetical protein